MDRADFRAVLCEGKGPCRTKHALLAASAQEQDLAVVLTLGIYARHERHTPGEGAALARDNLASLPEAHGDLTYEGQRRDVTRPGAAPAEPIAQCWYEAALVPEPMGAFTVTLPRQCMQTWVNNNAAIVRGQRVEDVGRLRAECMAALAQ